jgi:Zn-dependent M28 family amino/carboxypeptidase
MELIEDMDAAVATGIPLIFTNEKSANEWFNLDLAKNIDGLKKKRKPLFSNKSIRLCEREVEAALNVSVTDEMVSSENVLAFIEGSDETLKNEIVVVSAHYDHIGIVNGEVNNGADDDGSGTVSAMEIAEAFIQAKKDGNGPKRSILILHVSGEEKGLFGSDYYTRHPVYPMENTVCDLNIDMIGRVDEAHKDNEKYVYLIGSDRLSMDLHNISETVNKQTSNLALDYTFNSEDDPNQFYYRSDHYNFAKNNIPVIFYFSGVHEDYHKPGDDPEKILYDKMCSIAQLVFSTAWEVANAPTRLQMKN